MTLQTQLATLETSGLVRLAQVEPELEYLFKHALVQDAAYSSLLKTDRRLLHRTVGETLELIYADRLNDLAPQLGEHFAEAGDAEKALRYFSMAGDTAANVYANAEAATHYAHAIELIQRNPLASNGYLIQLYLQRGRVLELSGEYGEALANYVDMETIAREQSNRPLELAALVAQTTVRSVFSSVFDLAEGERLAQQSLTLARALADAAAESKILWNLLLLSRSAGNHARGIEYGEQSITIARSLNLREQLAYTLTDISLSYITLGQGPQGRAVLAEANTLWRDLGNRPMLVDNLARTAASNLASGHFVQAIRSGQEAQHIAQSISNPWGQMFSLIWVGLAQIFTGDIQSGLTTLTESLRLSEESHVAIAALNLYPELALLYSTLGAIERGFAASRQFATYFDKFPAWQPVSLAIQAILQIRHGDLVEAETTLAAIHPSPRFSGIFSPVTLARAEIEFALAQGRYPEALAAIDQISNHLQQTEMPVFLPEMRYRQGQALMALGQWTEAQSILTDARQLADNMSARLWLWPILASLSELRLKQNNLVEARLLREQARTIIAYIADHCPAELRVSFLDLADVRQVLKDV